MGYHCKYYLLKDLTSWLQVSSFLETFGFSMKNSELRFSDLRFEDFITNHYPDIHSM